MFVFHSRQATFPVSLQNVHPVHVPVLLRLIVVPASQVDLSQLLNYCHEDILFFRDSVKQEGWKWWEVIL